MQYTTNYNWKLPDQTDNYNIQNQNDNWSSLDTTLKSISNAVSAAQNSANAAIPSSEIGAANGVAPLDVNALVPSANLPKASSTALGAIKIGSGISQAGDGTISATPASIGAIASTLLAAANGVASLDANTRLPVAQLPSAIPATNLPIATKTALGLVEVGAGIDVDVNGVISSHLVTSGGTIGGPLTIAGGLTLNSFTAANAVVTELLLDGNAGGTAANAQNYALTRFPQNNHNSILPKVDLGLVVWDGTSSFMPLGFDYTDRVVGLGVDGGWATKTAHNVIDDGANGYAQFSKIGIGLLPVSTDAGLVLGSGPSWTTAGWSKVARVANGGMLEFYGSGGGNYDYGFGNSGGILYLMATTAEDGSAAPSYVMQANGTAVTFNGNLTVQGTLTVNGGGIMKPRTTKTTSGSVTSTSYTSILNISGKAGRLKSIFVTTPTSATTAIQILIDGVVVSSNASLATASSSGWVTPFDGPNTTTLLGTSQYNSDLDMQFQSSVSVQISSTAGAVSYALQYETE